MISTILEVNDLLIYKYAFVTKKKSEIQEIIDNTQLSIDSMSRWFYSGFYSHSIRDDKNSTLAIEREKNRMEFLMQKKQNLLYALNSELNDEQVNLTETYQEIQLKLIEVLENELKYFMERIAKLKSDLNIKDPDGIDLTGFIDLDESDEIAIELWNIQNTLQKYNDKIHSIRESGEINLKSINTMLNEISNSTAEYNMCLLKLERETLHVDSNEVNWFKLTPREVVQQIFSINYENFDSLMIDPGFQLMLEANGDEYIKQMKKFMKKTGLEYNQIAKKRFNKINQSFMYLRNELVTKSTLKIRSIMDKLDQGSTSDFAVTSIQVLINILDHEYNHKLKFFNNENSDVKKDFLLEVAQLIKKYDNILDSDGVSQLWKNVSKSKVVGYHRTGINANNSYFGLSGAKTEAKKFCEDLSQGKIESIYRGTSLKDMQEEIIQEDSLEKYLTITKT